MPNAHPRPWLPQTWRSLRTSYELLANKPGHNIGGASRCGTDQKMNRFSGVGLRICALTNRRSSHAKRTGEKQEPTPCQIPTHERLRHVHDLPSERSTAPDFGCKPARFQRS